MKQETFRTSYQIGHFIAILISTIARRRFGRRCSEGPVSSLASRRCFRVVAAKPSHEVLASKQPLYLGAPPRRCLSPVSVGDLFTNREMWSCQRVIDTYIPAGGAASAGLDTL